MYPDLKGKVAIISGAGGALGSAVANRLHAEKMRLALIDVNESALKRVAGEWASASVLTAAVDLMRKEEVDRCVEQIAAKFGLIDVLVNVAGGFTFSGPVYEMNPDDLDSMISINVKTALLLSSAVARYLTKESRLGRIINIAARAALQGVAGIGAYSASKAALLRLTETLAMELLDKGVTVNAVLPSTIDTPANRRAMPDADPSKWVAPESLAGVIAFLASDEARDISGAAIPVYGRA